MFFEVLCDVIDDVAICDLFGHSAAAGNRVLKIMLLTYDDVIGYVERGEGVRLSLCARVGLATFPRA